MVESFVIFLIRYDVDLNPIDESGHLIRAL